jgi:ATP-dependent Clp protease ATP-binding subunit ClpC
MYESITDTAREVFRLANQEAMRLNHEYIGTEHLLLGLVNDCSGVAATVLKVHNIDQQRTRLEVEEHLEAGPDMTTMGKLPQSPQAKKVIEYAFDEARNLNHNYVGTEHILLGLLREQGGVAARVLANHGLTVEGAREEIEQIILHANPPASEQSKNS